MAATKSKLTRIEKRRRLDALFDRGGYVRLGKADDQKFTIDPEVESEDDLLIWVGPPSPLQREMAVREAQAGRARLMVDARSNENSTEWITIRGFIAELSREPLIDYILDLDETEFLSQGRRDVLMQKEWEDFNSLRDAMRQYEEAGSPQDDPEWKSLLERDRAFGEQVTERAVEHRADASAGYALMPREQLEEKAIEKRIEQAGSAAFMTKYEEWMLFYSCRDDVDHKLLYFDTPDDVKSLPDEVQVAFGTKLAAFIADAAEAKNSPGAASGSVSSVPPAEPETSESSTPEE